MRGVGTAGGGRVRGAAAGGGCAAPAAAPSGGFAVSVGGPPSPAEGTAPAAPPGAPGGATGIGLLALQAASAPPRRPAPAAVIAARRNAAACARADSLLAELTGLQGDMLAGRVDAGRLERLASLETGEDGADPALREAVQAIALRAAIELARRRPGREAGPP